jgi:hypothetical protein
MPKRNAISPSATQNATFVELRRQGAYNNGGDRNAYIPQKLLFSTASREQKEYGLPKIDVGSEFRARLKRL